MNRLVLKISAADYLDAGILSALRDGRDHDAKFSTTKIEIVPDRKDPRFISTLKNVKIVLKTESNEILILIGNLQCDYRPPFGAAFFLRRVVKETTEFESVKGVEFPIRFATLNDTLTDNNALAGLMEEL